MQYLRSKFWVFFLFYFVLSSAFPGDTRMPLVLGLRKAKWSAAKRSYNLGSAFLASPNKYAVDLQARYSQSAFTQLLSRFESGRADRERETHRGWEEPGPGQGQQGPTCDREKRPSQ